MATQLAERGHTTREKLGGIWSPALTPVDADLKPHPGRFVAHASSTTRRQRALQSQLSSDEPALHVVGGRRRAHESQSTYAAWSAPPFARDGASERRYHFWRCVRALPVFGDTSEN